jgi:hypothetical protein
MRVTRTRRYSTTQDDTAAKIGMSDQLPGIEPLSWAYVGPVSYRGKWDRPSEKRKVGSLLLPLTI